MLETSGAMASASPIGAWITLGARSRGAAEAPTAEPDPPPLDLDDVSARLSADSAIGQALADYEPRARATAHGTHGGGCAERRRTADRGSRDGHGQGPGVPAAGGDARRRRAAARGGLDGDDHAAGPAVRARSAAGAARRSAASARAGRARGQRAQGARQLRVPAALAGLAAVRRARDRGPHAAAQDAVLAAAHADGRSSRATTDAPRRGGVAAHQRRRRGVHARPLPVPPYRRVLSGARQAGGRGEPHRHHQPRPAAERPGHAQPRPARLLGADRRRGAPPRGRGNSPARLAHQRVGACAAAGAAVEPGGGPRLDGHACRRRWR